jgi:uncharacterized membrane protein
VFSVSDPLVAASSEVIGGPLGRHARTGPPYRTWWLPIRVLLAFTFVASALAFITFEHCRSADWKSPDMYTHVCYSDAAVLYTSRGLDQQRNPFASSGEDGPIAYPVITNIVIAATSWLVPTGTAPERRRTYFDINALLSVVFLAITVLLVARLVDPWRDALFVALAPAGILSLFIGWSTLAAMLSVLSLLLFRRGSPWLAGLALGCAIATAFYPVVLIAAFYLVGLKRRAFSDVDRVIIAALSSWLGINAIVAAFFADGVLAFYSQLLSQGASYGSIWLAASILFGWSVPALNVVWLLSLVLVLGGTALMMKKFRRQPTLGQAALLVGIAYFLTAKSYAPQQVLWLIPLAALAGLRWRDLAIWQGIEVIYHLALWQYIAVISDAQRGLDANAYGWITVLHIAGLIYLMWRTWQQMAIEVPEDQLDVQRLRLASQEPRQRSRP